MNPRRFVPRVRRPRWLTRPVAVLVAVLVGLGGLGGATGAVLGALGSTGSSFAEHDEWHGPGDGHGHGFRQDDDPAGPFRR